MATVRYSDLPAELRESSWTWGLFITARTWALIAAAVACFAIAPTFWVWLPVILVIGLMQYHLSVLGHHTLHRNVVPDRRVNDLLGRYFVHGPLGLPQDAMRRNHMIHHRDFEAPNDPELDHYDLRRHGRGTARGFILWAVTRFLGGEVFQAAARVLRGTSGQGSPERVSTANMLADWAAVAIVQFVLVVAFWAATGEFWAYLALWTAPQITVLTGLMALRTTLEHADPLVPPRRLFSFPNGPVERFVLGPLNFNFHAEHHLHAAVPAQHLAALHEYLRERDALTGVRVYPSYRRRFADVVRDLREHPLVREP